MTIRICKTKVLQQSKALNLSGSMSSAIIFNAASANVFWSTGAAPELGFGLEFKLEGNGGLGDKISPWDAACCDALTALFFLTFWPTRFFSFSDLICNRIGVKLSLILVGLCRYKPKKRFSKMHRLNDVTIKVIGFPETEF